MVESISMKPGLRGGDETLLDVEGLLSKLASVIER